MPLDPRDAGHLEALKICYYVSAGLGALMILFLIMHFMVFNSVFGALAELPESLPVTPEEPAISANSDTIVPEVLQTVSAETQQTMNAESNAVFQGMMDGLKWMYLGFGLLGVAQIVLNILCARAIAKRQSLTLIYVTAGINCISVPIGTILGVFTFVILARPTVTPLFKRL